MHIGHPKAVNIAFGKINNIPLSWSRYGRPDKPFELRLQYA